MVDMNREVYERNGIKATVDSNGIMSLIDKNIGKWLDHKNFTKIVTNQCSSKYRQIGKK